ncbi:hypothetical protein G7Z17_g4948 [Cylindrodendrum hubeiense]|uniref:Uncharacterized protein n=1 Tax=Cylindrodendrum hubeiense TaxID=595255 RepID=A0A9P5LGN5_9HYPO|nr:hypothetical protein G7Z17_g4948 [Cylindrodendrum hubeiense]
MPTSTQQCTNLQAPGGTNRVSVPMDASVPIDLAFALNESLAQPAAVKLVKAFNPLLRVSRGICFSHLIAPNFILLWCQSSGDGVQPPANAISSPSSPDFVTVPACKPAHLTSTAGVAAASLGNPSQEEKRL